jgi:para-aminobenzoate synthetase/4-amino-4-deoxychorismate lyase
MDTDMNFEAGTVICRLPGREEWGYFSSPARILSCCELDKVCSCITELEQALAAGYFAAGFITYEAGGAFDKALPRRDICDCPLLWMGIYKEPPREFEFSAGSGYAFGGEWTPEITQSEYAERLKAVHDSIVEGNIYQANYTFRMHCLNIEQPEQLFLALCRSHPVPYAAYINTGDAKVISLSPEIFLEKNGRQIFSSPMKGTMPRGKNAEADRRNAEFLRKDEKNLAENLMIVDMVRNDLGRVCVPGSVRVDPLFQVDTYGSVHQMISTVHGEVENNAGILDILKAAFPAASITGAPKVSAMHHIQQLEKSPRKIYTGSIGCFMPDGDFCLNVAIRTLLCNDKGAELGVGGGIVYDSKADSEWQEALLKGKFIRSAEPDFKVLETMLWRKDTGIEDWEQHLSRAEKSQRFFGGPWYCKNVESAYEQCSEKLEHLNYARIRMLVSIDGTVEIEVYQLDKTGWGKARINVKISPDRTDSQDVFLRHKTTRRQFYNDQFRHALAEGYDEVIFFNERGELTEGAITNIFVKLNGQWYTPPVACGLLHGTWRERMLKMLDAHEKIISREELSVAEEVLIGNSVRDGVSAEIK